VARSRWKRKEKIKVNNERNKTNGIRRTSLIIKDNKANRKKRKKKGEKRGTVIEQLSRGIHEK
jgi:hypothetical protein